MPVTLHWIAGAGLASAQVERWRNIPVSIAVDLQRNAGQIDPAIRPLRPPGQQPRLFGRAVTALCEPPDFGAVVYALHVIARGDVLVIAAAGNRETAMIGEILCGHLRRLGVIGVVCDGAVRDVRALAEWPDFAVFCRSVTPRGPDAAECGAVNVPVVIGGALVSPGDILIGDDDGLVALAPAFARSRIEDAEGKLAKEAKWIESLGAGKSAQETFGLPAPA